MTTTRAHLATLLSSLTGLDYHVAYNWLGAENSVYPTNPLGTLYSTNMDAYGSKTAVGATGRFARFATPEDGIRAAAHEILARPYYTGVLAAIRAKDPAAQRLAIVLSPWAGGNNHGGSGFSSAGIGGHASHYPGPAATSIPLTPAVALAGIAGIPPMAAGKGTLADLWPQVAPTHRLSVADVAFLVGELTLRSTADPIAVRAYYTQYIGTPISAVPVYGAPLDRNVFGIDPGKAVASLFGDWAWVPGLMVNVAIIVAILVLGYRGVREIAG